MQTSISRFFQSKGATTPTPNAASSQGATRVEPTPTAKGKGKGAAVSKKAGGKKGGAADAGAGDGKKREDVKEREEADAMETDAGRPQDDDDDDDVQFVESRAPAEGGGGPEEKATPSKRVGGKGLAALSPAGKRAKVEDGSKKGVGMDFEPSQDRQKRFVNKLARAAAAGGEEGTGGAEAVGHNRGRIGSKPTSKYTSMEQQVLSLKRAHPDLLLMVECGYRFRFFGEDALEAAKVLGIYAYIGHNFYVGSVPTVRVKVHLRRLVEAGHKVGIVRQMETAALKAAGLSTGTKSGTFDRKVVAIFTSSTFNEDDPALSFVTQPAAAKSANSGGAGKVAAPSGKQGKLSFGGGKKAAAAEEEPEEEPEDEEEEGAEEEGGGVVLVEAGAGGGQGQGHVDGREQWMMAVVEDDDSDEEHKGGDGPAVRLSVVAVNAKTGVLVYDHFTDNAQRMELDTRLRQLAPVEMLLPSPSLSSASEACIAHFQAQAVDAAGRPRVTRVERIPPAQLDPTHASKVVASYLDKLNPTDGKAEGKAVSPSSWSSLPSACHRALGSLIEHVKTFGIERILAKPDLRPFATAVSMTLDGVTLRDLEIFASQPDGKEQGSLFKLLDKTVTAFGQRRLREWVRRPLLRGDDIQKRLDTVEELAFDTPQCLEGLCDRLKKLPDVEAILTTLHTRRVSPKRLLLLLTSLLDVATRVPTQTDAQAQVRSVALREVLEHMPRDEIMQSMQEVLSLMDPEAAKTENKVELFVDPNFFPRLTAKKEAIKDVELGLQDELQEIRRLLRRPSLDYRTLRTGVNSYTEYLIELRKSEANSAKIPQDWAVVSQTKDFVRYHTPKVLGLLRKLLVHREEVQSAGEEAWCEYVALADDRLYAMLRNMLSALASLDAYLSLSKVARLPGYVKPQYPPSGTMGSIEVTGGRHPVLEQVLEGGPPLVPNDVGLGVGKDAKHGCLIVSGPNMGGKSSYVRMVALLSIMGQLGSYVPAESASLSILDGVYTRMGAGDDLIAGMSTFLLELWNTSFILSKATQRSLVILDELGRGTATYDGMAIAEATVRYLVKRVGCPCLFVTHYPQLADLTHDNTLKCRDGSPRVAAGHMAFHESQKTGTEKDANYDITFLYQMVEGGAGRSYGLNVAKMAGLDDELLSLAATKSKELQLKVEGMSHADNDGTQDKGPANEAKEDERADEEPEMTHAEAEDAMDEEDVSEADVGPEADKILDALRQLSKEIEDEEVSGASEKVYMKRRRELLRKMIELQAEAKQLLQTEGQEQQPELTGHGEDVMDVVA